MPEQEAFVKQLLDFLQQSPTPFHAVNTMQARLDQQGFRRLHEADAWQLEAGGRYYVIRNDSSLVAFRLASDFSPAQGWRMVGAHTDSPCLKVKPQPLLRRQGYVQLGVEVYGGVLLSPWFDRDLSLAGRVSFHDSHNRLCSALLDFARPVAVIPSLAIHLNREANDGRKINPQQELPPVLLQADGEFDFHGLLLQQLRKQHPQRDIAAILDYELSFYDAQPPAQVGLGGQFISSARIDNLLSCFIGLQALLADADSNSLLVCNDHEEVGSQSASGAQGPMLRHILQRIAGDNEAFIRSLSQSLMVSVDNAHGVHPNYADRHDEQHLPRLNGGPVIKINANQRYASNSESAAWFRFCCQQAGVPVQDFVMRSDMACGSTIGPITAAELGVRTVDVGVPQWAMHSIRETAGSADALSMCRVLQTFYRQPLASFTGE